MLVKEATGTETEISWEDYIDVIAVDALLLSLPCDQCIYSMDVI